MTNITPNFEPDNKAVYDSEDKGSLQTKTKSSEGNDDSNKSLQSQPTITSSSGTSSNNAASLNNAENLAGSSSNSGVGGNAKAGGENFWSNGGGAAKSSTGKSKLRGFTSSATSGRRKYILGGAIGSALALILFGFAAIVPYELVHIEQTLLKYEAKVEQRFEKNDAKKILQKIVNGHRGKTQAQEDAKAATEEAAGESLEAGMDSFDLTSPTVEQDLSRAGITVETDPSTGAFTGLKNASGDITDQIGTNDTVFSDIETALPEWEVGQLESYRPVMTDEAGASFSGLSNTEDDNVLKTAEDKISNGADSSDLTAAASEEDKAPTSADTAAEANAANGGIQASGQVEAAIQEADAVIEKGGTEAQALDAAEAGFKPTDPVLASTLLSDGCSVKEAADVASKTRVPTIIKLLMRHWNFLISVADQLKTGHITGNEANQSLQILGGNPSANSSNTDSESFAASAGWQNATGGQNGVPIDESAKPIKNEGTNIVNDIDAALPGSGFACKALTSPAGGIIQGLIGIGQFVADDFSLGASQAVIIAGNAGLTLALRNVVIPDIIKYFTPIGLNGAENSVQWLNNSDAGANLSFNNYGRRLGANPQTTSNANAQYATASLDQKAQDSQLPLLDRTFALSNPDSLASHFANDLPVGISSNIYSFRDYFTNIPTILAHSFSTIFSPKLFAQATPTNPGAPYGTTQYGFSDSEVNKYDPVANEQYLFGNVSAGGKSTSRIAALGNPNTYQDSPTGDGNNNDLLHCYVDPFAMIEEDNPNFDPTILPQNDPGSDQNCGAIGMLDYTSAPPNATDMPNDQTAISIYCIALGSPAGCAGTMASQVSDEIGHYRQYLLDTHVMNDYTSLTNTK